MNGLEEAINNALQKAGDPDAQTRARIYQSARAALENGLRKQAVTDTQLIEDQRRELEAIIERIEGEVQNKVSVDKGRLEPDFDFNDVTPSRDAPAEAVSAAPVLDRVETDREPNLRDEHATDDFAPTPEERVARKAERQATKKKRRWPARVFSLVVLICFAGTAYWWAETTGLLLSPAERDTSVPNPPPSVNAGDFDANTGLRPIGPKGEFGSEWKTVFTPADTSRVRAGGDASAETKNDLGEEVLAISAPAGGAQSKVRIGIPPDVLRQTAGKTATVEIALRGLDAETQVSVECDFGAAGNCSRHRFNVADRKGEFFFNIDVPAEADGNSAFLINSAAGGVDGEAEVFAIRLLPGGTELK